MLTSKLQKEDDGHRELSMDAVHKRAQNYEVATSPTVANPPATVFTYE